VRNIAVLVLLVMKMWYKQQDG